MSHSTQTQLPLNLDMSEQKEKAIPDQEEKVTYSTTAQQPYSEIPPRRRTLLVWIVSVAGFLGPVAGNIYIPLLPLYEDVFGVSTTTINGTVSVFMFAFGVFPLLWASFADKEGRRPLYLISLPFYIVSAILLAAVPPQIAVLYVLRVFQAFGASSLVSIGAASISDVVEPKNRGKAISVFLLGPQLGPMLGLVLSLVGAGGNWRWTFGILAILAGAVYFAIFFLLPETLRSLVENGACYRDKGYVVPFRELLTFGHVPQHKHKGIPGIIFSVMKYVLIMWCSVIGAFLFASFYALLVTFALVLKNDYNYTQAHVSVAYLCPSFALICGSLLTGKISDVLQVKGLNPDKSPHHPERRLMIQSVGLVVCIGGLCCYGWAIEHHWSVVSVFVFTFMISIGTSSVSVVNMTYMTECPTGYVSTNVAVGNMARNLAAGVCSLIIAKLVRAMGYGWCFSGLAVLNVMSLGMSMVISKYGAGWNRKRREREKGGEREK